MLRFIDIEYLRGRAPDDRKLFQDAVPFRHLVSDGLVFPQRLHELIGAFPDEHWTGWKNIDHEHQRSKFACDDHGLIPEPLDRLISELNSGPVIAWLETITGIKEILPDPTLQGGGLHLTLPGGYLTPHTDFHVGRNKRLYRRLNLLLYLNAGWTKENQGLLELWEKGGAVAREVVPEAGRTVLFQTDDQSVHGFSKPVLNRRRCSVALYYYTAEEADTFSGDGATYWQTQTKGAAGLGGRLRMGGQRSLLVTARALSAMSWRIARTAGKLGR